MYTLMDYAWFFIIYAFLGWCVEIIFHAIKSRKFVNRGFLNGPVCPIYGFGMVIIIFFLEPLKENLFLLFIGAFFLTSILEFITGFVLEKIFHDKWWDYTNMPFNIKGYVCLIFSLAWGIAGVFMMKIVHPPIATSIVLLDRLLGYVILFILMALLLIDFIITIQGIIKIKSRLHILDEIASKLRHYSDDIGKSIYKGTAFAIMTKDTVKENIDELKIKYNHLVEEKGFVHRRLEKSYPNIKKRLSDLYQLKKKKENEQPMDEKSNI